MIRLTFCLNPFIFDSMFFPIAWRIIFRIVLSVCQIDDDTKLWNRFNNIESCMSMKDIKGELSCSSWKPNGNGVYLSSNGRLSEMCCEEG